MAVTQVVVCDCCNTALDSSSVLDAAILTFQAESGEVLQAHFGIKCGCAGAVVAQAHEGDHGTHIPPPAPAPVDLSARRHFRQAFPSRHRHPSLRRKQLTTRNIKHINKALEGDIHMAQFNAEAQDVVDNLSAQVGYLTKENAILSARLSDAERQINDLTGDSVPTQAPAPE